MKLRISSLLYLPLLLAVAPGAAWAQQAAQTLYPAMAPIAQYLMASADAEIALARTAAPVSGDAGVLVLTSQGYESAAKGKNGFVCMVLRSWTAGLDDVEFWNPKIRAPHCFNDVAVRSYIPLIVKRTDLVLQGKSKAQIEATIHAALDKKELPMQELGSMVYMMSKQGYLNDRAAGPWHPHLMFFLPESYAGSWGADLARVPIFAAPDPLDRLVIFMVPVAQWSDGTPGPAMEE